MRAQQVFCFQARRTGAPQTYPGRLYAARTAGGKYIYPRTAQQQNIPSLNKDKKPIIYIPANRLALWTNAYPIRSYTLRADFSAPKIPLKATQTNIRRKYPKQTAQPHVLFFHIILLSTHTDKFAALYAQKEYSEES